MLAASTGAHKHTHSFHLQFRVTQCWHKHWNTHTLSLTLLLSPQGCFTHTLSWAHQQSNRRGGRIYVSDYANDIYTINRLNHILQITAATLTWSASCDAALPVSPSCTCYYGNSLGCFKFCVSDFVRVTYVLHLCSSSIDPMHWCLEPVHWLKVKVSSFLWAELSWRQNSDCEPSRGRLWVLRWKMGYLQRDIYICPIKKPTLHH